MIPYGRQLISQTDIDAVVEALQSPLITQGPRVSNFEQAIADYCGAPYGVAMSSATAALHLACLALGVGPGDRVWTVPNTFVASANCARYCGADVDFVDIDPNTGNMSITALATKLTEAQASGHLPKVIIPVHFAGASCDMAGIAALTKPLGIHIIEDASHAIGGQYQEQPIGNCAYSDCSVFSFHPVKMITCGEGGVLTTQNAELAEKVATLRSHGITRDPAHMHADNPEPWYYEQHALGFNYRMTDIQAALGLSQLSQLDRFTQVRNTLAKRYHDAFADSPVSTLQVPADMYSSYHLFVIQVPAAHRLATFNALREAGIGVHVHYIPVHWQPDFATLGFQRGQFPAAEYYYSQAITLPLYVELTEAEQDFIIQQVLMLARQWS
ncbi:UDP-4-amino-4,6-dideoxy-N-acetyl-beta-L-altrosamine transaminase [Aliidiomarina taiwanensis]|uniref:UDP-4-amino-4, 6-dideoxy-N-acetyl-beta-L-altrosamine transaminase n=1 Tax=Aliidiomarina taiwanensis TaxID=946228 RepID=A0A432X824_9GAMM|nr:UDP-4-amino-4,6-dideoxy-N-acetyl-beta-L-altrosamine transaminase [Aliidiomarina taiwanensis]RUO43031.1 UDP-4-amino-4,6-dideoxy-N-acetyl-beta-L-altrosamine transaminase [Aliidiomarina taiwanensis]